MAVFYESLSLPYELRYIINPSHNASENNHVTYLIPAHGNSHTNYVDYNVRISSDEQMDIMILK